MNLNRLFSTLAIAILSSLAYASSVYADFINSPDKATPRPAIPFKAHILVQPDPVPYGVDPTFIIDILTPGIRFYGIQLGQLSGYLGSDPLDPRNNNLSTSDVYWYEDLKIPVRNRVIKYRATQKQLLRLPIGRFAFQVYARDTKGNLRVASIRFLVVPKIHAKK